MKQGMTRTATKKADQYFADTSHGKAPGLRRGMKRQRSRRSRRMWHREIQAAHQS